MITNYGELKTQVAAYLYNRKDLDTQIPTFISLAEKKIFRQLRCRFNEVQVDGDLALDATAITLPTDFLEMKFITVNGKPLERRSDIDYLSRIAVDNAGGEPTWFARVLNEIKLWRTADSDYDFSFIYWATQEGDLVEDEDDTPVLLFAPELYLWGSLIEAMPFLVKDERLATFQALFTQSMDEIDHQTKEGEFAGSNVTVSSAYSDPIRGIQSGRRL